MPGRCLEWLTPERLLLQRENPNNSGRIGQERAVGAVAMAGCFFYEVTPNSEQRKNITRKLTVPMFEVRQEDGVDPVQPIGMRRHHEGAR